jgi:hypothetical protein
MRISRSSIVLAAFPLLAAVGCAVAPAEAPLAPPSPDILPLRTLRLYETGVGYFERSGTLGARATTSLPVPAGHLDDAIASLVVLNAGAGGAVSGLEFASSVTKASARSRAGLPAEPTTPIAFESLLTSMKGEKVSVVVREGKEPIVGRVVEVTMEVDDARARALAERKDAKSDETPKRLVVTLLTASGAITQVPAETIMQIRPIYPAFATRLDSALDSLGTRSARNARALRLVGDAHGQITFGYVAETPIWRASYRLIEGPPGEGGKSSAVLQGWALLHNDTDEHWRNVHLELVNGEPDSFVFPMAAPRYARRQLVHPDNPLSTLPQLEDTTADTLWGDHLDEVASGEGWGQGFGSGHGRLGGSHRAGAPSIRMGATSVDGSTKSSSLLDVGNLADLAPTTGVEQGALFAYALPDGFSLGAHASALVPFVQRAVSAETVAFFSGPDVGGRTAVHFVNSTGQTLPTGTITVFGAGGFTGETSLDRLKPGERRFLQIGNDLDDEVSQKKTTRRDESKRLTFEVDPTDRTRDRLDEHFLRTTENTWELENRSGGARSFYVGVAVDRNAKITNADRLDFDEATSQPVVVFDVKSKEKVSRTFTTVEGLSKNLSMDHMTEKNVRALLAKTTIPAPELTILQQAIPRVRALENAHAAVAAADVTARVAEEALARLREDLKALGGGTAATGGGAAAAPLVKRVVDAEDRVEGARKSKETAEKTLSDRRDALRDALLGLTVRPSQ